MRSFQRSCGAVMLGLCAYLSGSLTWAEPLKSPETGACQWADWHVFKQHYLSREGRVIDGSDPRQITTSEGQSYALFFALVANDQRAFETIYEWTREHLAQGDLTAQLPAWLWGDSGQGYRVLDANSAADSDLWIAYTLLEAGRVWHNPYYRNVGYFLAKRIANTLLYDTPPLGKQLLPAAHGFVDGDAVRLNPSYAPMFILDYLASTEPMTPWPALQKGSLAMLLATQKNAVSPDWVTWSKGRFYYTGKQGDVGSYNAIRTYLWAGMMPPDMDGQAALLTSLEPFVAKVQAHGVPEYTFAQTGRLAGQGPIGFRAALIPFMQAQGQTVLAERYYQQINAELQTNNNRHYYANVLSLFGKGWFEQRYHFSTSGHVQLAWQTGSCAQ